MAYDAQRFQDILAMIPQSLLDSDSDIDDGAIAEAAEELDRAANEIAACGTQNEVDEKILDIICAYIPADENTNQVLGKAIDAFWTEYNAPDEA